MHFSNQFFLTALPSLVCDGVMLTHWRYWSFALSHWHDVSHPCQHSHSTAAHYGERNPSLGICNSYHKTIDGYFTIHYQRIERSTTVCLRPRGRNCSICAEEVQSFLTELHYTPHLFNNTYQWQDRRWNAEKPSTTLYPCMIIQFGNQS